MAGDWIKMRSCLLRHPKVVRIASALKADKLRVIGGLMSVWCLFDEQSEDGVLDGYTPEALDSEIGFEGFSRGMESVEWLQIDGERLVLPRFESHNGQSAKRRAQDADRKREVRKTSASEADKKRTREEKRRDLKEDAESDDSDADASPDGTNDPKATIWNLGVKLLTGIGESEKSARAFLGRFAKLDESKLAEVIGYLSANQKIEPKAYIAAAFVPKKLEVAL